jgi:hypothetical protein
LFVKKTATFKRTLDKTRSSKKHFDCACLLSVELAASDMNAKY